MIDEGVIKFECDWTEGPPPSAQSVYELNTTRQRLYQRGLIGHDANANVDYGNISIRGPGADQMLITGTQTGHIPRLAPQHFALVTGWDIVSNQVSCVGAIKASAETLTHAAIYGLSAAIGAVIHVHHQALWEKLCGTITTTDAGTAYGTPEMAKEFQALYQETDLAQQKIAAMGGHPGGLISFGDSLAEAEQRLLDYLPG